jgi:hypothetical protein
MLTVTKHGLYVPEQGEHSSAKVCLRGPDVVVGLQHDPQFPEQRRCAGRHGVVHAVAAQTEAEVDAKRLEDREQWYVARFCADDAPDWNAARFVSRSSPT